MFKSPSSGREFRDAIVSSLSPGEQLVCFADCYENQYRLPNDSELRNGHTDWICTGVDWFFLALTNINIRQGKWVFRELGREGWQGFLGAVTMQPKTIVPKPIISTMSTFALNDIVTITHSRGATAGGWEIYLRPLLTKALVPQWSQPELISLTLTLTNGSAIEGLSPFVEINELVKSIDAAKSGALVVKNTTAAADALNQLVPLLNDGILTQEEFDRAKDGFLGATVEVRESSVGLLRQLHSLHKSGVLSESEFNMKKWDILSKDE